MEKVLFSSFHQMVWVKEPTNENEYGSRDVHDYFLTALRGSKHLQASTNQSIECISPLTLVYQKQAEQHGQSTGEEGPQQSAVSVFKSKSQINSIKNKNNHWLVIHTSELSVQWCVPITYLVQPHEAHCFEEIALSYSSSLQHSTRTSIHRQASCY